MPSMPKVSFHHCMHFFCESTVGTFTFSLSLLSSITTCVSQIDDAVGGKKHQPEEMHQRIYRLSTSSLVICGILKSSFFFFVSFFNFCEHFSYVMGSSCMALIGTVRLVSERAREGARECKRARESASERDRVRVSAIECKRAR